MVLADKRFLKKRNQLPKWINQAILESEVNLSTDMAVGSAKKFLRGMAQPFKNVDQEGISTWSLADLERHKEKVEEENIRVLQEAQREAIEGGVKERTDVVMDEFEDEEAIAGMMELDG